MLSQQEKEKLWSLVKPIKTGMLTTWNGTFVHSRPMQHVNKAFENGSLYYFTSATHGKAQEIARYNQVSISYADVTNESYVSLSGTAEIIRDRALMDEFWNMFVEAWFPEGKNDPDLALLKFDAHLAEYWDAPSSTMVQLFHLAKAKITDTPPQMGEHRKAG